MPVHRGLQDFHQRMRHASWTSWVGGNYVAGANIAGFLKVADSMMDQGLV